MLESLSNKIPDVPAFPGPATVRALQEGDLERPVHQVHRRPATATLAALHSKEDEIAAGGQQPGQSGRCCKPRRLPVEACRVRINCRTRCRRFRYSRRMKEFSLWIGRLKVARWSFRETNSFLKFEFEFDCVSVFKSIRIRFNWLAQFSSTWGIRASRHELFCFGAHHEVFIGVHKAFTIRQSGWKQTFEGYIILLVIRPVGFKRISHGG